MKIEYIILIIFLVIIMVIVMEYNELVQSKKKIERNRSLVDTFLKKRYDLIPNLVEVCKGYSNFEQSTLENIVKLRASYMRNPMESTGKELNKAEQNLIMLMENYPDLKASNQFLNLQKEITNVENEIQASRRIYVNSITSYNNLVMRFPSSLIAKMIGFSEEKLPRYEYDEVHVKF